MEGTVMVAFTDGKHPNNTMTSKIGRNAFFMRLDNKVTEFIVSQKYMLKAKSL